MQVFNSASRELTVSSTATINSTPAGSGSPPAVDNTVTLLGEDGTHIAYPGSNDFYFHVPAGTEFSDFFAEPPGVINSVSLTVGGSPFTASLGTAVFDEAEQQRDINNLEGRVGNLENQIAQHSPDLTDIRVPTWEAFQPPRGVSQPRGANRLTNATITEDRVNTYSTANLYYVAENVGTNLVVAPDFEVNDVALVAEVTNFADSRAVLLSFGSATTIEVGEGRHISNHGTGRGCLLYTSPSPRDS